MTPERRAELIGHLVNPDLTDEHGKAVVVELLGETLNDIGRIADAIESLARVHAGVALET